MGWSRREILNSRRARVPWNLMGSWVASDQVRGLSSGKAELHGVVDGSAPGILTKHVCEEMGRTINLEVETDPTAARGMCFSSGRREDEARPGPIALDPGRNSGQGRALDEGQGRRERGRHGNQRFRWNYSPAFVAEVIPSSPRRADRFCA